jgi:hypothetical protein
MKRVVRLAVFGLHSDVKVNPYSTLTFRRIFEENGFLICDLKDSPDIAVCVDYLDVNSFPKNEVKNCFKVLIRNEPEVVLPAAYSRKVLSLFDEVITVGVGSNQRWPQFFPEKLHNFSRDERVTTKQVLINANKMSFIKGENYSLRRQAVCKIESIDCFGRDWDKSLKWEVRNAFSLFQRALFSRRKMTLAPLLQLGRKPIVWKGAPKEKYETYRDYRYAIVIENSSTYLSEKIFDAIVSGCIPIYVGPSVRDFEIPSSLIIEVPPTIQGISAGIETAEKVDYVKWWRDSQAWLSDDDVRNKWDFQNVYIRLSQQIRASYLNSISKS